MLRRARAARAASTSAGRPACCCSSPARVFVADRPRLRPRDACSDEPRAAPFAPRSARSPRSPACATQSAAAVAPAAPGFLLGLWHGFIFPVAWLVSLFVPEVAVYAVPNNGGWYDFGYFLGIVVFGVGARKTRIVYRDRVHPRARGVVERQR